jgi:UDP-3-O-[3-hydroxymyristoyl] glucosamine N-acyltransferase
MTTGELCEALGLTLRGDPHRVISGAAAVDVAGPDQLAFVATLKYFAAGQESLAGCLIAPSDYPLAEGQAVIDSPQPRAHFAAALALLYPPLALRSGIHLSAFVDDAAFIDPTAEIGPNVTIASGAQIHAYVRIGAGCSVGADTIVLDRTVLYPNVTLYHGVTIGSRCILHSGAVIGADGFGFEMAGGQYRKVLQVGTVVVGDDVEIGANSCIDRAALGETVIGDGTKLDNMVHIAHNCRIGRHVVIAAQTGLAGGVTIGDYAVIGGQVGVGDKARIEARAIVGSGAGILTSKIVRAGEPVWGTPARPLRRYLAQLAAVSRLSSRVSSKLPLKNSPVPADRSVHDGTDT